MKKWLVFLFIALFLISLVKADEIAGSVIIDWRENIYQELYQNEGLNTKPNLDQWRDIVEDNKDQGTTTIGGWKNSWNWPGVQDSSDAYVYQGAPKIQRQIYMDYRNPSIKWRVSHHFLKKDVDLRFKVAGNLKKQDWHEYYIKIPYQKRIEHSGIYGGGSILPGTWSYYYLYIPIEEYLVYGDWKESNNYFSEPLALKDYLDLDDISVETAYNREDKWIYNDMNPNKEGIRLVRSAEPKIFLDPDYITETVEKRLFYPKEMTAFDNIICEVKSKEAGLDIDGRLITLDENDEELLITNGKLEFWKKIDDFYYYQWKIKGWDKGWTEDKEVMEKIVENKKIKCKISGSINSESRPYTTSNVVHLWGYDYAYKVGYQRADNSELSPKKIVSQGIDIYEKGFHGIDPFKTYQDYFSHYVLLDKSSDYSVQYKKTFFFKKFSEEETFAGFVGIGDRSRIYMNERFSKDSPIVAMHEFGHGFCDLSDEYVYREWRPVPFRKFNCRLPPGAQDWIPYGALEYKGCTSSSLTGVLRPSITSIMKNAYLIPKFNIVSCGYCLQKIRGGLIEENWQECENLDTIKKDEGNSIYDCGEDGKSSIQCFDYSSGECDVLEGKLCFIPEDKKIGRCSFNGICNPIGNCNLDNLRVLGCIYDDNLYFDSSTERLRQGNCSECVNLNCEDLEDGDYCTKDSGDYIEIGICSNGECVIDELECIKELDCENKGEIKDLGCGACINHKCIPKNQGFCEKKYEDELIGFGYCVDGECVINDSIECLFIENCIDLGKISHDECGECNENFKCVYKDADCKEDGIFGSCSFGGCVVDYDFECRNGMSWDCKAAGKIANLACGDCVNHMCEFKERECKEGENDFGTCSQGECVINNDWECRKDQRIDCVKSGEIGDSECGICTDDHKCCTDSECGYQTTECTKEENNDLIGFGICSGGECVVDQLWECIDSNSANSFDCMNKGATKDLECGKCVDYLCEFIETECEKTEDDNLIGFGSCLLGTCNVDYNWECRTENPIDCALSGKVQDLSCARCDASNKCEIKVGETCDIDGEGPEPSGTCNEQGKCVVS